MALDDLVNVCYKVLEDLPQEFLESITPTYWDPTIRDPSKKKLVTAKFIDQFLDYQIPSIL